jgi:HK97 family phage prohead protease
MKQINKTISCNIIKSEMLNNHIGMIEGYASTFNNADRDGDVILKGAFTESILDFRNRGQKIPMLSGHSRDKLIGGFDPNLMVEDEYGLKVVGEIDLDTQEGKEDYSLIKKGFLDSFSIGFRISMDDTYKEGETTIFKKVDLLEISTTPIPANIDARINKVKSLDNNVDYPMIDTVEWDESQSIDDIRDYTDSNNEPSDTYKNGFLYYDESNCKDYSAYKYPFVFLSDGEFKAVEEAIISINEQLEDDKSISDDIKNEIRAKILKYNREIINKKLDQQLNILYSETIDKFISTFKEDK